jgi:hypothetical protein
VTGRRLPLLVALAGTFGLGVPAAGASCPDNRILLTGVNVTSSKAALDTTGFNAHGSYDLKQGQVSSNVSFNDPGWAGSSVTTDDEYWTVGLPAGTAVDFSAEFHVSGSWNVYPGVPQGNFTCQGSIASESDSAGFALPAGGCCHGSISQPLAISLHRLAQAPFRLRLRLASEDYRGRVDVAGTLVFTGLPSGAAVVSCQGFVSDPAIVADGPRSGIPSALGIAEVTPNPTSGALALSLRLPAPGPARLEVFDLLGRNLITRELRFDRPGSFPIRIEEAQALAPGVYTLRLTQAGRNVTARFTVVR